MGSETYYTLVKLCMIFGSVSIFCAAAHASIDKVEVIRTPTMETIKIENTHYIKMHRLACEKPFNTHNNYTKKDFNVIEDNNEHCNGSEHAQICHTKVIINGINCTETNILLKKEN